jgi:hypothetical protein
MSQVPHRVLPHRVLFEYLKLTHGRVVALEQLLLPLNLSGPSVELGLLHRIASSPRRRDLFQDQGQLGRQWVWSTGEQEDYRFGSAWTEMRLVTNSTPMTEQVSKGSQRAASKSALAFASAVAKASTPRWRHDVNGVVYMITARDC